MIKMAPVNAIPRIVNAKILCIQTPPYTKAKQPKTPAILALNIHRSLQHIGIGAAQNPPQASAIRKPIIQPPPCQAATDLMLIG